MKKLLIIVLILCSPAFALKEYYSISKSVRSLGMGGAFYGLSNDEYALFYNPAGLNFYEGGSQAMMSFNFHMAPSVLSAVNKIMDRTGNNSDVGVDDIVNDLTEFQGQALYGGVAVFPYYLRKHFAIGLMLTDLKTNIAILGRELDTSVDLTAISDSGLFIAYADNLFRKDLYYGFTIKGMLRAGGRKSYSVLDIAGASDFQVNLQELGGGGIGLDCDFGVIYDIPYKPYGITSRASLVLNNLFASKFDLVNLSEEFGLPPALTRSVTLASHTVFPGIWWFDNFHFLLDFAEFKLGGESDPNLGARTGSFFKHMNWGVEAPMNGWFFVRLGFRQGYWTAGLGLSARFVKVDLATYQEELMSNPGKMGSRRYALRLVFGIGAAAPTVSAKVKKEAPPKPVLPEEQKPEADQLTPEKPVVTPDAKEVTPPAETPKVPSEETPKVPETPKTPN